jgi:hypothetical protein
MLVYQRVIDMFLVIFAAPISLYTEWLTHPPLGAL